MPELNRKAFDLLQRELGLPDCLWLFSQSGVGAGNDTEERRALLAGLSIEEFRQAISVPVAPQTRSIQE